MDSQVPRWATAVALDHMTHLVAGVDKAKLRWPKLALVQCATQELALTENNLQMERQASLDNTIRSKRIVDKNE